MVLIAQPSRPTRLVHGVDLAVTLPLPTRVPPLPPPKPPTPGHIPTVHPGGRVVWRSPQIPSLDDARAGKRVDISNLHDEVSVRRADLASLADGEVQRVAQLMARQHLGTLMHEPPKMTPQPSPLLMHISGLDSSDSRPRTHASSRATPAARVMTATASMPSLDDSSGLHDGVMSRKRGSKPASRAAVVHLEATLRARLSAAHDSLPEQVRAWDAAFAEVIRQVGLHCAERGSLLEEVRARYDDWIARLICTVAELHGARDRKREQEEEEAVQQEDRLQELLLANHGLTHKVSVLKRDLEWNRKAAAMMAGEHADPRRQWKGVKHAATASNLLARTAAAAAGGGRVESGSAAARMSSKAEILTSMLSEVRDELSPAQIGSLLRVVLADDGRAADADEAHESRREEIAASLIEYLPLASQSNFVVDLLPSFTPAALSGLVDRLASDGGAGLGALAKTHELAAEKLSAIGGADSHAVRTARMSYEGGASAYEGATASGVKQQVEALLRAVPADERARILAELAAEEATAGGGAGEVGGGVGGGAGSTTSAAPSERPSFVQRRESRKQSRAAQAPSSVLEGISGGASTTGAIAEATGILDEARASSTIGAASVAEMLRKRQPASAELSDADVCKMIGGAYAMKLETDASARLHIGRSRLQVRDELWRYLSAQHTRRSEAVQALHNLAAALEGRAAPNQGRTTGGPTPNQGLRTRITAFRSLCGIAIAAGTNWPAPQADFYFTSLQALFPSWAPMSRSAVAEALSAPTILVPAEQVERALKYLVRDGALLIRLTTRVKGAAADQLLASTGKAAGVDLDWLMQVLMQAWEDSQLMAQRALQTIFFDADDNGDGILQVRNLPGSPGPRAATYYASHTHTLACLYVACVPGVCVSSPRAAR